MKAAALELPGADPITREMLGVNGDNSAFRESAAVCEQSWRGETLWLCGAAPGGPGIASSWQQLGHSPG